ncbi:MULTISPECIES: nuclear transport factor 2 family protein [Bacillaceae]|uniref:nuclear transport factor 2 family protein n=1 Tax=Bacillaceae TaxID=186817 RepID=UPI002964E2F6|nr:nuclear transport factor 2 family protein [Bacillus infantis]MDW2879483.1 nuclear transport factor 2 family protein [Bacillus infantis]
MEHSFLEEHVLHLEKRLMTYQAKELDELLASDFVEYGSSGNKYDKKAQLDAVSETKTNNHIRLTISDFNIKFLSDDIILATISNLSA